MLTYITLALCLIIFVRLFTYSRHGAMYRPVISLLATIIMMASGAVALLIACGDLRIGWVALPLVALLAVFTAMAVWCKGNLAAAIRSIFGGLV